MRASSLLRQLAKGGCAARRLSWVTPGFSQSRRCKTTASERDVIRLTIGRIGGRPSRPRRASSSREAVAGPDDARSAYAPARPRQAACQELGRDASAVGVGGDGGRPVHVPAVEEAARLRRPQSVQGPRLVVPAARVVDARGGATAAGVGPAPPAGSPAALVARPGPLAGVAPGPLRPAHALVPPVAVAEVLAASPVEAGVLVRLREDGAAHVAAEGASARAHAEAAGPRGAAGFAPVVEAVARLRDQSAA